MTERTQSDSSARSGGHQLPVVVVVDGLPATAFQQRIKLLGAAANLAGTGITCVPSSLKPISSALFSRQMLFTDADG